MRKALVSRPRGFSMIEVLIAVLVLAVGLLGVAALQMTSMNSGQEGYFRTQATAIAEDLASRVKSNSEAWAFSADFTGLSITNAAQAYLNNFAVNPYACNAPPAQFCRPDQAFGAGVECTSPQQIAFDMWEVCQSAQNLLPGGQVAGLLNGSRLSIAVAWLATQRQEGAGETQDIRNPRCTGEFNFAAEMDCIVLETVP